MLTGLEQDRLDRLIADYAYGPARTLLTQAARPCVSLFLQDIPPDRGQQQPIALGASRIGGAPDLPADMPWPILEDGFAAYGEERAPGYAGFLMQIALEDMPTLVEQSLPRFGQLFVFDLGPSRPFDSSFLVRYSAAPKSALQRTQRPADLPCAAEQSCFALGDGFAIEGVQGFDFESLNDDDLDLYRQVAHAMDVDDLAEGLIETFAAFEQAARDPHAADRAARGYPESWWRVGRLFGAMGRSMDGHVGAMGVAPLLTIESNTLAEFSSPADGASIQLSMPKSAPRPWADFVQVTANLIV